MPSKRESAFRSMKILDPVRLCGPEANRWLQDFLGPDNERLANDCFAALRAFRTHDHESGCRLLEAVDEALEARQGSAVAASHILRRWSFGAWAYHRYALGDLDSAEAYMITAEREIGAAIARRSFLVPLVNHCVDFRIQRARIARKRLEWSRVRDHIGVLRGMFGGDVPFIRLPDGNAVFLRDFRAFYESLDLSDELREDVRTVLDPDYPHDRDLDRLEEDIFAIPDFVIPYA